MASYDLSCIKIFRAVDRSGVSPNYVYTPDTTALYAMVDATLVAEAKAGLTPAQQAALDGYVYVPTATDFSDRQFLTWAGTDPSPIYFKVTGTTLQQDTKLQAALSKRYK